MKNKTLIKLTLVTLLAPTFLNAQAAIAAEVPVAKAPVAETPKADTPKVEVPKVEVPKVETPAPTPEVTPTPEVVPTPEVTPTPEIVPTPEVTPTPEVVPTPEVTPTPEVAPTMPAAPGVETPTPTPGDEIGHIPGENNGGVGAPTLSVAPVKMLKKGSIFKPLEGVYAYNDLGNVSNRVKATHNVNTNVVTPDDKPYKVTYTVDSVDGGPKTTKTIDVFVYDDKEVGMLTASIKDFTIAQNGNITQKINELLVVKDPYGKVLPASEYVVATNGSAGGGEVGKFNISIIVQSNQYNTTVETTVTITVLKGLTLKAADRSILVGDTFNPKEGVTAFETMADGSTKNLGDYNGTTDSGLSIIGTVDTAVAGVYPITYSAKSASGVFESVTVNITVRESVLTITAPAKLTIMQGETFDAAEHATANDEKDGIKPVTVVSSDVDASAIGTYTVVYSATNTSGKIVNHIMTVDVIERKSEIVAKDQTVYQDEVITQAMIDSWATVKDPVENDLSAVGVVREGTIDTTIAGAVFNVDYSVTNSAGNETVASITVTVAKRLATITAADQTVKIGETVTDKMIQNWATASDPVDGDNLAVTEFDVVNGPIDTNIPGSKYTIEYSYTNTANNETKKTITLSVAELLMPKLAVDNQVMYIGDKLTEDMILDWATTENAEDVGFEVLGEAIKVTAVGSTLVEAGTHQIKFTAYSGTNNGKQERALTTQPFAPKNVEKTITLTVKAKDNQEPIDKGNSTTKQNTNKTTPKTKAIKSAKANLPKTGAKETSMMSSMMGLMMVVVYFFFKKKQEGMDVEL